MLRLHYRHKKKNFLYTKCQIEIKLDETKEEINKNDSASASSESEYSLKHIILV